MWENLLHGLTALGNGQAIAYLVLGSCIGVILGVVPGLGGSVVLTIILAFIYHIGVTGTLCLFLATQAASYFSASITSILLNTPAHPEAFAVTFDGFPMAQRGEAGRALGISATSTCIGGLVGCAVLVGFLQIINKLPLIFHPPEYVALIVIALLLVGTLGTDQVSKSIISMGLALMISTVGPSPVTGVYRYTFNAVGLLGGVSIVALFLGLFAIPQMILIFGSGSTIARQNLLGQDVAHATPVRLQRGMIRQVRQGVFDTFSHWFVLIRAGLIGVITGVVPGIGGFAANFVSYGVAQQFSKNRDKFGTGIPEGIIAPEGSSLAKEAGGMIPILGLGVPGSVGGALFLAALTIKGVRTGYGFVGNYPTLAYETVWVIALGGIIGTTIGLVGAPVLARITRVPGPTLVPFIMSIALIGTFAADGSFFPIMEIALFALVGFVLRRLRYSLAAFGLGLVLGPTLETNIYLTRNLYHGFTFLTRPLADVLFALAIVLLVTKAVQLRRAARKDRAADLERMQARGLTLERHVRPYPVLSLVCTVVIVAVAVPFAVYGALQYNFTTALMPVLGGATAGSVALWRLPRDFTNWRRHRREVRLGGSDYGSQNATVQVEPGIDSATVASEETSPEMATHGGVPLTQVAGAILEGGSALMDVAVTELIHDEESAVVGGSLSGTSDETSLNVNQAPEIRDKSWAPHGQYRRELTAFGAFAALVALCYLIGFEYGVGLFCVCYGLLFTRRFLSRLAYRVAFAVLSALAMGGIAYEIFHVLALQFTPLL